MTAPSQYYFGARFTCPAEGLDKVKVAMGKVLQDLKQAGQIEWNDQEFEITEDKLMSSAVLSAQHHGSIQCTASLDFDELLVDMSENE